MTHDARHTQGERELEKKRSLRLWLIASHSNARLSLYFHTGTRAFLWLSQWPNRWRDSPSAMNDPSSSSPPHSVRVCTASPRKKTRRTTLRSLQNWSWIRFLRHGKNGAGLSSHSRLEKNHHKSYFVCHQSTVNYIRSYFFPLLSSPSILPTMRAVLLFFPATLWSILPYPGARFSPFHLLPQTLSLFASFQMRWKGTLLSVTSIDARTHILLLVGCCGCIKEKEDSLLANQKINFQFKEKEKQITPCTTRLIIRRQNLICYLVTRGYMEP